MVAALAAASSHRKSDELAIAPAAMFSSIRFASSGAWKEFDVRETRTKMLKSDSDKAIRRVRLPAIRTE